MTCRRLAGTLATRGTPTKTASWRPLNRSSTRTCPPLRHRWRRWFGGISLAIHHLAHGHDWYERGTRSQTAGLAFLWRLRVLSFLASSSLADIRSRSTTGLSASPYVPKDVFLTFCVYSETSEGHVATGTVGRRKVPSCSFLWSSFQLRVPSWCLFVA